MGKWIALLRGVNVGGHNKLPMAEFRDMLAGQGFRDAKTYIQSGNAVFSSDDPAPKVSNDIAAGIKSRFGFEPRVMVLGATKMQSAIANNPFPQATADPKTLHLFFTAQTFGDLDMDDLQSRAKNGEEVRLLADVLYFYTPNGFGRSDLAAKLPSVVKAPMTGRNLRSCMKISELAGPE